VGWIKVANVRDEWQALLNKVIEFPLHKMSCRTFSSVVVLFPQF